MSRIYINYIIIKKQGSNKHKRSYYLVFINFNIYFDKNQLGYFDIKLYNDINFILDCKGENYKI